MSNVTDDLERRLSLEKRILETQKQQFETQRAIAVARGNTQAVRDADAAYARLGRTAESTAVNTSRVRESISSVSATRPGIMSLDEAFSKFSKTLDAVADPVINASMRLNDLARERRAVVMSLSDELAGPSRLFTLLANNARTAGEQITSVGQDSVGKLKQLSEIYGESASSLYRTLTSQQADFIANAAKTDDVFVNAQAAMTSFYTSASGFKEGDGGKLVPDSFFRVQGVPIMDIMGGVEAAFEPFTAILKDESLSKPFAKDMLNPEKIEESKKEVVKIGVAMKGLGIDTTEVKELIRQNFIRTGEATTDLFNTVIKASETGQDAFGYNAAMIADDIVKMMNASDIFGFRTADDFAKISARAHDLHLSIQEVQSTMGKFNTFESAANSVSQLNAALGTNFDAMELMTARYEDPTQFIELLREGLLSTGKAFNELPLAYQNLLQQQLGLSGEALAAIMDGRIRSEEELAAAQKAVNAAYDADEDADDALLERQKMRVKVNQDMIESAGQLQDEAARAAKMFATAGIEIVESAQRTQEQLRKMSATYVTQTTDSYKEIVKAVTEGDKAITEAGLTTAQLFLEKNIADTVNRVTKTVIDDYLKLLNDGIKQLDVFMRKENLIDPKEKLESISDARETTKRIRSQPVEDVVLKGNLSDGDRVVLAKYGELSAYKLDSRDDVRASPPPQPVAPPPQTPTPVRTTPASTLPNTVQASLQGVGTSLRIELDIGQITDMVLRDIMMNKPAVFGGISG